MWRWIGEFKHRMADDSFPETLDAFIDRWDSFEKAGRKSWGIRKAGEFGGVAVSNVTGMVTRDIHCIFRKDFWGRETTLPALTLIFEEMFSGGTEKLSTMAFADNNSMAWLMRAMGATKEGLLKNQTRRGGKLVDMVMLGLEKERFYELRGKHEQHVGQHRHHGVVEPALQPGLESKPDRNDGRVVDGIDNDIRPDSGANGKDAESGTAGGGIERLERLKSVIDQSPILHRAGAGSGA